MAGETPRRITYNPAFLSEKELVDSFVVRESDLALLMEAIRENSTTSNQHLLVIGARGMGKTTLVLRAVAAVRADPSLAERWYPIVFSEESYEVGTSGEFWLEAIFHLAKQTAEPARERAYHEMKSEREDKRLYDRALAYLMDFADRNRKRLLIVVENLNMILGEQIEADAAWDIRHTLLNETRIMLVATATTRFEEMERADHAMYELFRVQELQALDAAACRRLWAARTGVELTGDRIRPVQILTGGNPRLVAILSSFAAGRSLRGLMDDLAELVDEHTSYFKTNLEMLPAAERKVFVALADLWQPSTARQVGQAARIEVNAASAQLARLEKRGAVSVLPGRQRTKVYQVAERLYNVYHLMRRAHGHNTPIRLVVDFMYAFYDPDELVNATQAIVDEACGLGDRRHAHYATYQAILEAAGDGPLRRRLVEATTPAFFDMPDAPVSLREMVERIRRHEKRPQPRESLVKLREATQRRRRDAYAWLALEQRSV